MRVFILLGFSVIVLLLSNSVFSQSVGISNAAITPDASSIFEVRATNKGVLITRVALTSAVDVATIAAPATSLLVYNTATAGVTPNDVSPGYYYWNGVQWVKFFTGPESEDWHLIGNAGTNPATNFLGTTDAQDLQFRTGNTNRMRILSTGNVGIGTTAPTELLHVAGGNVYASTGDFYAAAFNGVINCGGGIMSATVNVISDGTVNLNLADGDEDLYINDDLEVDDDVRIEGGIDDGAGYGTANYVLVTNGSNDITWTDARLIPGGNDDWNILGNSGTVAGTNFLGTTDAQALDFRTGNTIRMRLANGYQLQANSITSAGAPFYSWLSDPNTGMFSPAADYLGFSTGGLERLRMNSAAVVFNENSYSCDFRIESDAQNDMFFVDASTNRIGINTIAPAGQIHFISTGENIWITQWDNTTAVGALTRFQHSNTANGSRVLMGTTNYDASAFQASGVIGLSLNNTTTGSGGIGVYGSANNESGNAVEGYLFYAGGYSGWAGYFNADVYSGGLYLGSDRRLKRDIKPIENALDIVMQIEPVEYYYDTEKYPYMGFDENRLSYGFVAQDLEIVVPNMVKEKNLNLHTEGMTTADFQQKREVEQFKVVNYTLMIPILTQAVKEQQEEIESLEQRIEALEAIINASE
jgi:hypothetical protein